MNGSYTPKNLPVGGEETREVSPRSLAEALLVKLFLKNDSLLLSLQQKLWFLRGQSAELLHVIVKMGLTESWCYFVAMNQFADPS